MSQKVIDFGAVKKKKTKPPTKPITEFLPTEKPTTPKPREKKKEKEESKTEVTKERKTIVVSLDGKKYKITSDLCRIMKWQITGVSSRGRVIPISKFFVKLFTAVVESEES